MCATVAPLARKTVNRIFSLVKFSTKPSGMSDSRYAEWLVEKAMKENDLGQANLEEVEAAVESAIERYKVPTLSNFYEQQEALLTRKRTKTGNEHGRRRDNKRQRVEISYGGQPVTVDGTLPSAFAPSGARRYTAYDGTARVTFESDFPPPSPTHLDYPSVVWNPTGIAPPQGDRKAIDRQTLDPARLKTWSARKRRDFDTQNTVMGGYSAYKVACNALPWIEVDKAPRENVGASSWEWLHLVSFKMGGIDNRPQQARNLVAGTYECNSQMISLEEAVKDLVLIDGLTLLVEVIATCHPGSHLGTRIDYYVDYRKPDGVEIRYHQIFDPCSHINPASGDKAIMYQTMRDCFGLSNKVTFAPPPATGGFSPIVSSSSPGGAAKSGT